VRLQLPEDVAEPVGVTCQHVRMSQEGPAPGLMHQLDGLRDVETTLGG